MCVYNFFTFQVVPIVDIMVFANMNLFLAASFACTFSNHWQLIDITRIILTVKTNLPVLNFLWVAAKTILTAAFTASKTNTRF